MEKQKHAETLSYLCKMIIKNWHKHICISDLIEFMPKNEPIKENKPKKEK